MDYHIKKGWYEFDTMRRSFRAEFEPWDYDSMCYHERAMDVFMGLVVVQDPFIAMGSS